MDDDDDVPSRSRSRSRSPSPLPPPISVVHPSSSPPPKGLPFDSVTVAAAGPQSHPQNLTLAVSIPHPPASGNGGREDCWSEGATSALIDAWGERFIDLNRGSLKQKQWQEVADAVNSRDDYLKPPRTDVQCKNRIDTLKKKYKLQKAKIAGGGPSVSSSWPFFRRLDALLGPAISKQPPPTAVAAAARSRFPQKQRTNLPAKRKASQPPASPSSTSDSLPPSAAAAAAANWRRRRLPAAGLKELTRALLKFGEIYQRVECSKLQQAMEMERRRMGFTKELEMQRLQFFMKTQMELSKLKRYRRSAAGTGAGVHNHHHSRRRHQQTPGNGDGQRG
ncbi:hypothetical protein AXF42_Ash011746 [Apostasia shenzhenica]|uniref:Myb/SANT-like DNA-binding domain-containing protein n=1 Tax=Apostasia shenzhenica TaxID=1088818 RepID=A0A2H9ZUU9_9ASPA|nr:hypothetical protein AXF42_Ash011746 [Apostasia shenzhenica]